MNYGWFSRAGGSEWILLGRQFASQLEAIGGFDQNVAVFPWLDEFTHEWSPTFGCCGHCLAVWQNIRDFPTDWSLGCFAPRFRFGDKVLTGKRAGGHLFLADCFADESFRFWCELVVPGAVVVEKSQKPVEESCEHGQTLRLWPMAGLGFNLFPLYHVGIKCQAEIVILPYECYISRVFRLAGKCNGIFKNGV